MTAIRSLGLVLSMLLAAGGFSPAQDDDFTRKERLQLQKESKLSGRIKVYRIASIRINAAMQSAAAKGDFTAAPEMLKQWISVLTVSRKDIEVNITGKKKSKPLIKYEIHLRKALDNIKNMKIKAPLEQQDIFDSCIVQAEVIRKVFINILLHQ